MVNTWINAIYNRSYADVQSVMNNPDQIAPKGSYNYFDPNRIENNTAYVLEYMLEKKIIRAAPVLRIKTDWKENEIIVANEMKRIVENVAILCSMSNPMIKDQLPTLYLATQMNYVLANDIERALDIMHNQPPIPPDYFPFVINNGIITRVERTDGSIETINSNACLLAEDEVAYILGIAPEPEAEYKRFTVWSGNTDDLQYVDDITAISTTYIGQYHETTLTANFRSIVPRRLKLTNAYISVDGDETAESGPTEGIYEAGEDVMIIADIASVGKKFYCWEGTQDALDAISVSDMDPSTVWLTMPACDVNLNSKYINAGQHKLTVANGTGTGWYDYNELVSISFEIPEELQERYEFSNWSGSTKTISDIYANNTTLIMPDENITVGAIARYIPINYHITIDGGVINNSYTSIDAVKGTMLQLTPNTYSGYGFSRWHITGPGTIELDNIFIVGEGDSTIEGIFLPYYILTVRNMNNDPEYTITRSAMSGEKFGDILTSQYAGDKKFLYWSDRNR